MEEEGTGGCVSETHGEDAAESTRRPACTHAEDEQGDIGGDTSRGDHGDHDIHGDGGNSRLVGHDGDGRAGSSLSQLDAEDDDASVWESTQDALQYHVSEQEMAKRKKRGSTRGPSRDGTRGVARKKRTGGGKAKKKTPTMLPKTTSNTSAKMSSSHVHHRQPQHRQPQHRQPQVVDAGDRARRQEHPAPEQHVSLSVPLKSRMARRSNRGTPLEDADEKASTAGDGLLSDEGEEEEGEGGAVGIPPLDGSFDDMDIEGGVYDVDIDGDDRTGGNDDENG